MGQGTKSLRNTTSPLLQPPCVSHPKGKDQKLFLFAGHYTPRQDRRTRSVRVPLDWSDLNKELPSLQQAKGRFSVCDMITAWILPQHLSWSSSPEWDTREISSKPARRLIFPGSPEFTTPCLLDKCNCRNGAIKRCTTYRMIAMLLY